MPVAEYHARCSSAPDPDHAGPDLASVPLQSTVRSTLEIFLEKFDLIADAPEAVAKLRGLVLDLAVRGKLPTQDPNDEPAGGLLQSSTSLDFSMLAELPANWTWARVDETGRVDLGRQRAPQHHRGPHMRPYLRVQNVYEARIDISDVKEMNFTPAEFETFALRDGDLLLNEGQSRELVGRPAIYRGEVPGACFQNTLVRYRHFDFVLPEYALVAFRAYMRNGRFQKASKQTTNIAHLSAGRFAALEFPLPPLAEQKRIVAKVDELMALCDRLEAQLKSRDEKHAALARASLARFADAPTPANLQFLFRPSYSLTPAELRSAILRQALLGRVTWEPRSLKPDRSHLSRLQLEHRKTWEAGQLAAFEQKKAIPKNDAWVKRYVAPDLPDSEVLPDIPEHWAWVPLELTCPTIIDSPHRTPVYADAGQYPALRPRDVAGGLLKLNQAARVETSEYERQTERRKPRCGDIVYSRELSFGWAVILPAEPQMCLSQGMVSMQAASEVDANFMCIMLNSPIVREQAEAAAIGAAHPHVNLKDIRVFAIPLPPLAEQRRIVAKVEQLMALVDVLETQLAASRATAANLLSALVAELTTA